MTAGPLCLVDAHGLSCIMVRYGALEREEGGERRGGGVESR